MNQYPQNWSTEIRPAVLARDNNRCAFCGVPNYAVKVGGHVYYRSKRYAEAKAWAEKEREKTDLNVSVVVLTIAHLHDPDPMNCDMRNLAALCQKCHNQHNNHATIVVCTTLRGCLLEL